MSLIEDLRREEARRRIAALYPGQNVDDVRASLIGGEYPGMSAGDIASVALESLAASADGLGQGFVKALSVPERIERSLGTFRLASGGVQQLDPGEPSDTERYLGALFGVISPLTQAGTGLLRDIGTNSPDFSRTKEGFKTGLNRFGQAAAEAASPWAGAEHDDAEYVPGSWTQGAVESQGAEAMRDAGLNPELGPSIDTIMETLLGLHAVTPGKAAKPTIPRTAGLKMATPRMQGSGMMEGARLGRGEARGRRQPGIGHDPTFPETPMAIPGKPSGEQDSLESQLRASLDYLKAKKQPQDKAANLAAVQAEPPDVKLASVRSGERPYAVFDEAISKPEVDKIMDSGLAVTTLRKTPMFGKRAVHVVYDPSKTPKEEVAAAAKSGNLLNFKPKGEAPPSVDPRQAPNISIPEVITAEPIRIGEHYNRKLKRTEPIYLDSMQTDGQRKYYTIRDGGKVSLVEDPVEGYVQENRVDALPDRGKVRGATKAVTDVARHDAVARGMEYRGDETLSYGAIRRHEGEVVDGLMTWDPELNLYRTPRGNEPINTGLGQVFPSNEGLPDFLAGLTPSQMASKLLEVHGAEYAARRAAAGTESRTKGIRPDSITGRSGEVLGAGEAGLRPEVAGMASAESGAGPLGRGAEPQDVSLSGGRRMQWREPEGGPRQRPTGGIPPSRNTSSDSEDITAGVEPRFRRRMFRGRRDPVEVVFPSEAAALAFDYHAKLRRAWSMQGKGQYPDPAYYANQLGVEVKDLPRVTREYSELVINQGKALPKESADGVVGNLAIEAPPIGTPKETLRQKRPPLELPDPIASPVMQQLASDSETKLGQLVQQAAQRQKLRMHTAGIAPPPQAPPGVPATPSAAPGAPQTPPGAPPAPPKPPRKPGRGPAMPPPPRPPPPVQPRGAAYAAPKKPGDDPMVHVIKSQKKDHTGWRAEVKGLAVDGMLMKPATQERNIFGQLALVFSEPVETIMTAAAGKPFGKTGNRLELRDAISSMAGMRQAAMEGIYAASESWRTRQASGLFGDPQVALHQQRKTAIGRVLSNATRALTAADEWFSSYQFHNRLTQLAHIKARQEGLTKPADIAKRVDRLRRDPSAALKDGTNLRQSSINYATELAAKAPLNKNAKLYNLDYYTDKITEGLQFLDELSPVFTPVTAFARVANNLPKMALRSTPFGALLDSRTQAMLSAGGELRHRAIARMTTGTMIGIVADQLVQNGTIIGGWDEDPDRRYTWEHEGRRVKFEGLAEPFTTVLGMGADTSFAIRSLANVFNPDERAAIALNFARIFSSLPSKNFGAMATITQAFQDVSMGKADPMGILSGLAEGASKMIPGYGLAAQAATMIDNTMLESRGALDNLLKVIPYLNKGLPDRIDQKTGLPKVREFAAVDNPYAAMPDAWVEKLPAIFRLPILLHKAVNPLFSPAQSFPVGDELQQEMAAINLHIKPMTKTVDGEEIPARNYERYSIIAGKEGERRANEAMQKPGYFSLKPEDRKAIIKKVYSEEQSNALALYKHDNPNYANEVEKALSKGEWGEANRQAKLAKEADPGFKMPDVAAARLREKFEHEVKRGERKIQAGERIPQKDLDRLNALAPPSDEPDTPSERIGAVTHGLLNKMMDTELVRKLIPQDEFRKQKDALRAAGEMKQAALAEGNGAKVDEADRRIIETQTSIFNSAFNGKDEPPSLELRERIVERWAESEGPARAAYKEFLKTGWRDSQGRMRLDSDWRDFLHALKGNSLDDYLSTVHDSNRKMRLEALGRSIMASQTQAIQPQ